MNPDQGAHRILSFETESGAAYIYDDVSGVILPAEGPAAELVEGSASRDKSVPEAVFGRYREAERRRRPPTRPWTPERVRAEAMLAPGLQVTLIVTERCTLRCRYCVFSGSYQHSRTHGPADMPLETAKKAADYLARRYEEQRRFNPCGIEPTLGFYGGEPLLRMDLIREVVVYAQRNGYPFQYTVTTNGTVDDAETIEFLARNDFNVAVSLDGPPSEHDRNRVFPDGRGSFKHAYCFLLRLGEARQKHTPAGKSPRRHTILGCFDRGTDLPSIRGFFDDDDPVLAGSALRLSAVVPYRTSFYDGWSKDDLQRAPLSSRRLWAEYAKELVESAGRPRSLFGDAFFGSALRSVLMALASDPSPLRGSCSPGARLAVDPSGRLHACERVNNNYPLGNVTDGLDLNLTAELTSALERYFETHCGDCNVTRLCRVCFAQAAVGGPMEFEIPAEYCREASVSFRRTLSSLFSVLERNPSTREALGASRDVLHEDRIWNG